MPKAEIANGRLDSWKDIASYLDRDVRTVIRWEKDKGLPVRRVPGGQRQAVFAYKHEIDEWLHPTQERSQSPAIQQYCPPADAIVAVQPVIEAKRSHYVLVAVISLVVLVAFSAGVAAIHLFSPSVRVNSIVKLTDDGLPKLGLVTNGYEIYFNEKSEGRTVLSALPVAGGAIRHLQTGLPNPVPVDVSPDGSALLVLANEGIEVDEPLWIVPISGQPRPVGNIRCHSAVWFPGGRAIVYASGSSISLSFDEGASTRTLYSSTSVPTDLSWSADGRRLRFVLTDPHALTRSPWEVTLDDHLGVSSIAPLHLSDKECCAGWSKSSNGYFFYFTEQRSNAIWAAPDRRSGREGIPRRVNLDPLNVSNNTSVTNHFRKLFVLSETHSVSELLRFDIHTQGFVPYLPNVRGANLSFSPDGKWICFVSLTDEALWISRTDGSEQKQLTSAPMTIDLPRFSPDGKLIAFTARTSGRPWRIFVLSQTGGTPREVATGDENQGAPTWSHDGKFLVYANVDCQETNSCSVYRMALATGEKEELPHARGFRTARWSPDGRFVAAIQPQQHSLWLFDFNTQNWRLLADKIYGDDLSWSRDTRYLYVARPNDGGRAIVRVPVRGGEVEPVVDLSPFSMLAGDFSQWFCLTPDDSIILLRQAVASEIYAIDWSEN